MEQQALCRCVESISCSMQNDGCETWRCSSDLERVYRFVSPRCSFLTFTLSGVCGIISLSSLSHCQCVSAVWEIGSRYLIFVSLGFMCSRSLWVSMLIERLHTCFFSRDRSWVTSFAAFRLIELVAFFLIFFFCLGLCTSKNVVISWGI